MSIQRAGDVKVVCLRTRVGKEKCGYVKVAHLSTGV